MRSFCFFTLLVSASIVLLGCGGGQVIPELTPVTGVAKYKGKPLSEAEITFIPVESTVGSGASGKTDADGKFTLKYSRGGDGAPAGKYKVIAKKESLPKGAKAPSGETTAPGFQTLPPNISTAEQSNTFVTVAKGGGAVEVDFK